MEEGSLIGNILEVANMGALALLSFLIGLVMIFRNDMLKRMDQGAERTQEISIKQSEIAAHLARLNSKTEMTIDRLNRHEEECSDSKRDLWKAVHNKKEG